MPPSERLVLRIIAILWVLALLWLLVGALHNPDVTCSATYPC